MYRTSTPLVLSALILFACGETPQEPASEPDPKEATAEPQEATAEPKKTTAEPKEAAAEPKEAGAGSDAENNEAKTEMLDEPPEYPEELEEPKPDPNLPMGTIPDYGELGQTLIDALKEDTSSEIIETIASDLVVTGLIAMEKRKAAHPDCADYFSAIEAVAMTLKDLSVEDISSGYHADGKLPKTENSVCYHLKDLIVHPATVAAMAKTNFKDPNTREKAIGEISEVLQHYAEIK